MRLRKKSTRELICIACPIGCVLTVKTKRGVIRSVTGNRCAKGPVYAAQEVAGPRRVVTTTVRLAEGRIALLPVRTRGEVPRDLAREVVRAAAGVVAHAPIALGQVVLENAAGTGVDLIATRSVERATEGT